MQNPKALLKWFVRGLRRRLRDWWRGETDETYFDLCNLNRVNEHIVAVGVPALHPDPTQAEQSEAGAIRYIIAKLATHRGLRKRFPDALTQRTDYCNWLLQQPELSEAAKANIRAAFAGYRGERVKRIHELRDDLRESHYCLALTPHPDRIRYVQWLIVHGMPTYNVTVEEILWALYEIDEAPDHGLGLSYLSNRSWQAAVPHGLTVFGWSELKEFVRTKYNVPGRWIERTPLPNYYRPWDQLAIYRHVRQDWKHPFPMDAVEARNPAPVVEWLRGETGLPHLSRTWLRELHEDIANGLASAPAVNIMGHFRYPSGLQEAAVGVDRAMKAIGGRTTLRDLPVLFEYNWLEKETYRGVELFDQTIYIAAVNSFPETWIKRAGVHWRDGVRRIAIWYWELEELPQEWLAELGWPDEVWAPTQFIAETFRKYVNVPVIPMLPGLDLPAFTPQTRAYFRLPEDRMMFLVTFDMGSVMLRKNPLAVIAAFLLAFPADERVHLVIKVSRGESRPADYAKLLAATNNPRITLINEVLSRSDTLALMNLTDVYVSLHRSEGLGLGMAETMLMGKPVIATNYSGNTDFMTPDTAYLVDYTRVQIVDDVSPYPIGSYWAEPSVDHAAKLMRQIYDDPAQAQAVGQRAKQHVEELLSISAYGKRVAARLLEGRRQA